MSSQKNSSLIVIVCCLAVATGCKSAGRPAISDSTHQPATAPTDGSEIQSLLGQPLYAAPPADDLAKLEADLVQARKALAENPNDPDRIIWVGRRLGYLWRMHEAINVFTEGIRKHPDYAPLYRHRGHRYISIRRFDLAIADLQKAAALIEGKPDRIEPDGMPNERNIPLTTLGFNVWYHLALARYLSGDFAGALPAWKQALTLGARYEDNIVAVSNWMYLTLRRLGKTIEAARLMRRISIDMEMIENHAYFKLTLMYKGRYEPEDLLGQTDDAPLDDATLAYGVGAWHECNGRHSQAAAIFKRVVQGAYWPAFGYIAAEVELARMQQADPNPADGTAPQ